MQTVQVVHRRPLFIPFRLRCFLALAWLAHNTFRRSPGPKIVPPFMRRRACFTLQGAGLIRSGAVGNPKGLALRLRVKIVPPFMRRRACFTLQGAGLIRSGAVGNPKGLALRLRVKIVPPFILWRCFTCFRTMGSNRRDDVCING